MSTIVKTTGRPRLGDRKKVKVCVCLEPKVYNKLQTCLDDGKVTSISGMIFQILKNRYKNGIAQ